LAQRRRETAAACWSPCAWPGPEFGPWRSGAALVARHVAWASLPPYGSGPDHPMDGPGPVGL